MTTLTNRPDTALVVVDVHTASSRGAHERSPVMARISNRLESRQGQLPVIWFRHPDTGRGSDEAVPGCPGRPGG